jgi:hypothetical protein
MKFELSDYKLDVSDEDLLADVMRVAQKVGDAYLSFRTYKDKNGGKYSEGVFSRRFGSWLNVLTKLGLRTSRTTQEMKRISDQTLIDDLCRISMLINISKVSSVDYEKYGDYSYFTIKQRFGSWSNFVSSAGLEQTSFVSRVSDQDLFDEIERLWISLGRQPTTTDMKKSISRYSLDTFTRRFGGWRNSLHAFLERVDSEHQGDDCIETTELAENQESTTSESVPAIKLPKRPVKRTPRNINLRMRFTVLQRDNFACTACGASPSKNAATELHIDHIFPWSKGGETELDNLHTLCSKCNLGKSNN